MFIHEAKLAVRLSHANIVQVFDLGIAPIGDADARGDRGAARRLLHGDGVRARARPRDAARAVAAAAGDPAHRHVRLHRRRGRQGARPRASPPRRAVRPLGIVHRDVLPAERPPVARGRGEGHRLRHRQGARTRSIDAARPTRTRGTAARQVRVHEPRAGARRERRRAERPLLARHRPLRVRRGGEPLQRADDVRDAAPRAGVRVPADRVPPPRRAARPRRDPRDAMAKDPTARFPDAGQHVRGAARVPLRARPSASAGTTSPSSSRASARWTTRTTPPRDRRPISRRRRQQTAERTPVEVPARAASASSVVAHRGRRAARRRSIAPPRWASGAR